MISGEDDAGKTMLLLGISADELRAGRGVVWVDTDDMGASMVLERLRGFGATDDTIRRAVRLPASRGGAHRRRPR